MNSGKCVNCGVVIPDYVDEESELCDDCYQEFIKESREE